ncbi:MAG TPA: glycosyltransferase [Acidimicrobiales bacterium]|jgi:GT2 family glycosyltransferase|nr:glycosyltransferase [Acidimicrobiales bacterium]
MDTPRQAPPVVAVVVTCDSGPWLEEALEALGDQDYPNLSVLVVDAASAEDPTARVASVLPRAYVRRLDENRGYAAATNEVLSVVQGASHFLLCHDDVAPDPDAVRLMVEEAYRSNAGLVCPKLVDWDDPRRLLQVGMAVDKSGAPHPMVDRGELDQEQHDAVRDVFFAPGGCTLVRADLFAGLGGLDPVMHAFGEDLDLSWRAQVAGARVVVAPAARVRHLEAMSGGLRSPGGGPPPTGMAALRRRARPLQLRHRLRTVLKGYGAWHLVRVLPQVALLAVAETVFGVLSGHTATARDTARAWTWNLRRLGELRAARRAVRAVRRLPDSEVRRLQVRGSARFSGFVRGQLASERIRRRTTGALARRWGADDAGDEAAPGYVLALAVWSAVGLVLVVGSRHLITGRIPAVHQLSPFPGAWSMLRSFLSGWDLSGMGSESPAPAAFALLGVGGVVLGGATALLRTVVVLGSLGLGVVGAYRLAAPLGSLRPRLAALVVYAAIPLPYNALSRGQLGGLVAYGLAPWVLRSLLGAAGLPPFGDDADAPGRRRMVGLGLAVAVAAALAPPVAVMVVAIGMALGLSCVLAGGGAGMARALGASLGAVGVAAVALLPWSAGFALPGGGLSALTGVGSSTAASHSLGELLRFQTGSLGAPPVGWVFLVTAGLPLLVGRDWRLAWAARLWVVALTAWGLAWAAGRGHLPAPVAPPEVLLAPAAACVALAVALGVVAFELDMPRYRFGWRQVVFTAALVATVLGAVPVAAAALGGRWNVPREDFAGLLSWMPERRAEGAFRVLWLGDPAALPLTGWRLDDGLAYATSRGGHPDAAGLWPAASPGTTDRVADAVAAARGNGTTALGHLLAPAAVRYVVVPLRAAPSRATRRRLPPPPDLPLALDAQIDLKKLQGDAALLVYENAAWAPARARLGPDVDLHQGDDALAALRGVELAGSEPVLPAERSPTRFSGPLQEGDRVALAEASSSRWSLEVAGRSADRSEAFGWTNAFDSPATGPATLRYRTSPLRYAMVAGEVVVWALAIRYLVRTRRRSDGP